jgi:nucleoside phosphorylase
LECSKPVRTDQYRKGKSHDGLRGAVPEPDQNFIHERGSLEPFPTLSAQVLNQNISGASPLQHILNGLPVSEVSGVSLSAPVPSDPWLAEAEPASEDSPDELRHLNEDYILPDGESSMRGMTDPPGLRHPVNMPVLGVSTTGPLGTNNLRNFTPAVSGRSALHSWRKNDAYTVGLICSTATQYVALQAFLDETHDRLGFVDPEDPNDHTLGRFGRHNVVITLSFHLDLVTKNMIASFPNIKYFLSVGIGGCAPSKKHDVRLGDVVVGALENVDGLIQSGLCRLATSMSSETYPRDYSRAPLAVLSAVFGLMAQYELRGSYLGESISEVLQRMPRLQKKFSLPDLTSDRLHSVIPIQTVGNVPFSYEALLKSRTPRPMDEQGPVAHQGLIASSEVAIKNAWVRDSLAAKYDILCFETEAAGLPDNFTGLVIRGICHYCDSHKNNTWENYAAMAAAAYTSDLLHWLTPTYIRQPGDPAI